MLRELLADPNWELVHFYHQGNIKHRIHIHLERNEHPPVNLTCDANWVLVWFVWFIIEKHHFCIGVLKRWRGGRGRGGGGRGGGREALSNVLFILESHVTAIIHCRPRQEKRTSSNCSLASTRRAWSSAKWATRWFSSRWASVSGERNARTLNSHQPIPRKFLFAMRSLRMWGSGYCTKWRIQVQFS